MAKYKYEVYEVEKSNELVYQNVTNTDSVNVRNGCDPYTPDLENKIFKRGPKFGGMRGIPNGTFVCARKYNGTWKVFLSGDYTEEYCFKEESRGRKLYRIETVEKQGNLTETITAEENAYPQNGIKNGKWYVRKEKIQEHKLSIKDSDGKLVSIASIYFKDNNSNVINIAKAYSDEKLVWEKSINSINEPVYSDTGKSRYDFIVNDWNILKPNKNYKFVTNKADSEYALVISGSYTTIKNNNIFTITKNCDMQIRNMNYSYYDIEIYEVEEEANITI